MEALQLASVLEVTEVNDRNTFALLEPEWNALAEATDDQIFYRHEFLQTWVDNFAPKARLRVLLGRRAGRLVAALPLVETRASFYGVPVRQLNAAANTHSCRFDLLAEDGEEAAEAFWDHLANDSRWDVLRLTDVPEGGKAWALHRRAKAAGHPVGEWESLRSPFIPLPKKPEQLWGALHSKFKANLRRRRKKLEELGPVRFERVEGLEGLEEALEKGYALERSGWKGERGTAIAQDEATRGFYSELARKAAHRGWLALFFLSAGERNAAFQYGLRYGGKHLLLKPGYDEELKACSPGQLLMEEALKDCLMRGVSEFDFLGPDMTWKRDWTDQARVHTWLYVFRRNPLGRALCAAKFRWAPLVKGAMAQWKH